MKHRAAVTAVTYQHINTVYRSNCNHGSKERKKRNVRSLTARPMANNETENCSSPCENGRSWETRV